ncbi:MAG: lysylphosphatidylglycerol synthase transmembrane domain-containing protein [Candidatus Shapirobacteria bacterium]|jgi:hypothetical protein
MKDKLKIVLGSKWIRLIFSAVLIYFAFRRVNVVHLIGELRLVPIWFVVLFLVYSSVIMLIGGIRWATLLLDKPKFADYWTFTKATWGGGFYSLVFPTAVGGDLFKWLPLIEKYPELSKVRIASSVIIDRVIGFTAFSIVALVALVAGKILGYKFPEFLLWLFGALNIGVIGFYLFVYLVDFEKLVMKLPFGKRIMQVVSLLRAENKRKIFKCLLISLLAEPIWMLPVWFYSLVFKAGIGLLDVYIFMPVISLILVLPISVAGFGAREQLFLFFFSQLGIADEKILLVSTFGGVMGIIGALIGGVFLLIK